MKKLTNEEQRELILKNLNLFYNDTGSNIKVIENNNDSLNINFNQNFFQILIYCLFN